MCNFENLTAKIILKKSYFFGVIKKHAIILIVPSLTIAKIKTNIKNLPFQRIEKLNLEKLINYSKEKKFKVSFETQNKKLRRILKQYI